MGFACFKLLSKDTHGGLGQIKEMLSQVEPPQDSSPDLTLQSWNGRTVLTDLHNLVADMSAL
jgi:hypothetical protein